MPQDRTKANILANPAGDASHTCTKPPAEAVKLAKHINEVVQFKSTRKAEESEREANFIQTKLPNLFAEGSRAATSDAWARYAFGTG